MVEVQTASGPQRCRIRLLANRPLTLGQLKFCFLIIALGSLTFAVGFALLGLWVPLPFAGIELALLWWCLRSVWQRNSSLAESIEIGPDRVTVASSRPHFKRDFLTGWLRIEVRQDRSDWYPRRLLLSCYGDELEVGAFLTDTERNEAAEAMRVAVKSAIRPQRNNNQ